MKKSRSLRIFPLGYRMSRERAREQGWNIAMLCNPLLISIIIVDIRFWNWGVAICIYTKFNLTNVTSSLPLELSYELVSGVCCLPRGLELSSLWIIFGCPNWAIFVDFSSHPFLPSRFRALVSMGWGEYFPQNHFQCDSVSWLLHAGVIPAHGVAMDTILLGSNLLRLPLRCHPQGQCSLFSNNYVCDLRWASKREGEREAQ